jgi:serine dehydrogenase proteinase
VPTWGAISYELGRLSQQTAARLDPLQPSPHDIVRRKYLKALSTRTGRPVIVYASGWLEGRPVQDVTAVSVATRDRMGFMEAINGIPRGPLDLILHSPGGDGNAAEGIMRYLRDSGFGPIRAIIPLAAMSAATMMALCCDEILMGRHSNLGPIDPQFTINTPEGPRTAPAQAILDQFDRAQTECGQDQTKLAAWLPILRYYGPGLLPQCVTAQKAAEDMVVAGMHEHMFSDLEEPERTDRAKTIASWFNDHSTHMSHGRELGYREVLAHGVKVALLEEDDNLQDAVLSAWHGVQLTLAQVAVQKLIENSEGKAWLLSGAPTLQIALGSGGAPSGPPPIQPVPATPGVNRAARRHAERKR